MEEILRYKGGTLKRLLERQQLADDEGDVENMQRMQTIIAAYICDEYRNYLRLKNIGFYYR